MQFKRKLIKQTWENGKKNLVSGLHLAQIRATKPFFESLAPSVTRYHGQLSSRTISKKLMIQSWENLVTDGQMDGGDFIGRHQTNVKRPK